MSRLVHYNHSCILLYYTPQSLSEVNLKSSQNVKVKGSGEGEDYNKVEQEAELYLIKNAISKKPRNKLNKIVGITRDVDFDKPKLKISLEGVAVFE